MLGGGVSETGASTASRAAGCVMRQAAAGGKRKTLATPAFLRVADNAVRVASSLYLPILSRLPALGPRVSWCSSFRRRVIWCGVRDGETSRVSGTTSSACGLLRRSYATFFCGVWTDVAACAAATRVSAFSLTIRAARGDIHSGRAGRRRKLAFWRRGAGGGIRRRRRYRCIALYARRWATWAAEGRLRRAIYEDGSLPSGLIPAFLCAGAAAWLSYHINRWYQPIYLLLPFFKPACNLSSP